MTAHEVAFAQHFFTQCDNDEDRELIKVALAVAIPAAQMAREKRNELGDVASYTSTKSSSVDPVTIVDTAVEDYVVTTLEKRRPADGVIGEEGSEQRSVSGVSWIIDPIDGTVNFIYGIPAYAVSLAAAREGKVRAGVVVNIATGEIYAAARGAGAWKIDTVTRSGTKLEATRECALAQSLVATGFAYSSHWRATQARILTTVLPQVRDIRRIGSAALDLCMLAERRIDAYYEYGLHAWDYAAGMVIAQEAGAYVEAPPLSVPGTQGGLLWACGPQLIDEFGQLMGVLPPNILQEVGADL